MTDPGVNLETAATSGEREPALLEAGARVGQYEVLSLLGSGGMGRVYRARDTTLGREVALKALARSFRADPSTLRRFEREARVLAALNHPGIATLHGFELFDGSPYLVLEFIPGETLRDRLERSPLPVPEAIAVGIQVADALEEAHRRGVVHRDLKPSNVMLTGAGRVKVLDFGLAKTLPRPAGEEAKGPPTDVTTASGAALGTAPYMSPEQVRGDEVDTQSDVWAFGCLLYEMISGRRAFGGGSLPEIAAAILRDEVDWSRLPAGTPPTVRRLMRRCLRRDCHARLRAIGDARMELEELVSAGGEAAAPPPGVRLRRRLLPWAISAASAALAAVALLKWRAAPRTADLRLSLELPSAVALSDDYPAPFAVSPDGSRIAVVGLEGGAQRLYVRALDELVARPLQATEGATQPFFSPDGRWLGFFADRWLRKVPVAGGASVAIAEIGGNPRGAVWVPGGTIVLSPSQTSGLQRVSDAGGTPTALTALDTAAEDVSHRWPDALPGRRWVLYTAASGDSTYDEARLEIVSLETGERRVLLANASYGRHLGNGVLAFVRGGRLLTVDLAADGLATRGEPQVLVEGLRYDPRNGAAHLAVSPSGTFVYSPAAAIPPERYVSWLDAKGGLSRLVDTPRQFGQLRLSPDGSRVALRIGGHAASDLWSLDLASGTLSRLSSGLSPQRPAWRPDGRGVTVAAHEAGRWRLLTLPVGEEGPPSVLLEGADPMYPGDWTPDGQALVLQALSPGGEWNLRLLEVDSAGRAKGPARPLATTPFQEANAAVSPDGALLAYESDELDGVFHIYVRALLEGAERIRVSLSPARRPRWGADQRLYYWSTSSSRFESVRLGWQKGHLVADDARPVLDPELGTSVARRLVVSAVDGFDLDRTGRFLVLETAADTNPQPLGRPVVVIRRR